MATIENGHHWRTIGIYVFFVAVVVGALFAYQINTNHRLGRTDREACRNQRVLIDNQRTVLQIIDRNNAEFVHSATDGAEKRYFARSRLLVKQAEENLRSAPPCDP